MKKYLILMFLLLSSYSSAGWTAERLLLQPMSEFDGKTKEEMEKHRKQKMINSVFYHYNYEPRCFGDIKADEKWVGDAASCWRNKFSDGLSEASIWINNPNILVHPSLDKKYGAAVLYADMYNPVFCVYAKQLLFKPLRLMYDKEKKEITATYRAYNVLVGIGSHSNGALNIFLSTINAYDSGFNYFVLATAEDVEFNSERSSKKKYGALTKVSDTRTQFGFVEKCYLQSDYPCNNYRNVNDLAVRLQSKRAEMLFKFWKEKPASEKDKADFYYRIKFIE
ncbi:MAG: hypothetical protein NC218_00130 [Acetobacter sp.]|nr:hypothetical protein [Acetobacter sp.]